MFVCMLVQRLIVQKVRKAGYMSHPLWCRLAYSIAHASLGTDITGTMACLHGIKSSFSTTTVQHALAQAEAF